LNVVDRHNRNHKSEQQNRKLDDELYPCHNHYNDMYKCLVPWDYVASDGC
jgi:hypothetical protein